MDFGLIRLGGPVLWVILASGVLAFGVFIERSLHLHRARIKADDFCKERHRIGALPPSIGGREVRAHVAESRRAEESVAHRMRQHIGI